ncbi:hypothetical protein HDV05_004696 [Chytridiales sp. JEL 0842]|nr:hypothetical protein HDV05_004696 [Chytridiales sp. JEL 0842]
MTHALAPTPQTSVPTNSSALFTTLPLPWGLNYGPRRPFSPCPTTQNIIQDLLIMQPLTKRIKTFHLLDPVSGAVVCKNGETLFKALRGLKEEGKGGLWEVWLGFGFDGSEVRYKKEIAELKRLLVEFGTEWREFVKGVVVGSENIFRAEVTPPQMVQRVSEVRGIITKFWNTPPRTSTPEDEVSESTFKTRGNQTTATTGVPLITVADLSGGWYPDPLIQAVDVVMINVYPYWEGIDVRAGVRHQMGVYEAMKARASAFGKDVILGEVGWPTSGNRFDAAVPSVENLKVFYQEWNELANSKGVKSFWFEFCDESWKSPHVDHVERYWGLMHETRDGWKF